MVERITIDDVAARAGVSATTVSHVFSGHRPVRDETRAAVERVALELGYRPSAIARSLRIQRTNTAMIILPDITNPFYPEFARGVQDVLRAGDYHTLLCNTDSREEEERALLEEAISRRLDGIVFIGYWVQPAELVAVAASGIAVVGMGEEFADAPIDSVRSTDEEGARAETAYLIEHYGPAVAVIDGLKVAPVSRARIRGFHQALQAADVTLRDGYEVSQDFTREGGRRGMSVLLDLPVPPRAVFCANDLIAIGALDEVKARGLSVPGDIAIAGFDDIDSASLVQPSLTTVRNSPHALGAACGQLLLSRMSGEYVGVSRDTVVPAELVVRESA
jgi:DNA-binding LacI/PurR family transcriptional regulator